MEENKKTVKTQSTKAKKKGKEVSLFTILFAVLLVLAVVFLCTVVNWIVQTIRYKSYTDKMYDYGYNTLYSNKKATSIQKVSNIDMIKVILGTVNNTTDVKEVALVNKSEEMTDDDVWYKTAQIMGITNVQEDKLNKKVKTIDAVIAMMKALEKSLNITIEEANLNMNEKTLKNFSNEDKKYIAKAVSLGILENEDKEISNSKLIKGELNKLVVQVVNTYAITYYKTTSVDKDGNIIKNDVKFITNKEELPTNSKEYPYVVSNLEKSLYEIEFNIENETRFKTPKEVYSKLSGLYGQIDETIYRHFNNVLNIDYKTINEYNFKNSLNSTTTYLLDVQDVASYVAYVKKNKISLKGKVEPLLPIIYNSGERYMVRIKLTFEVLNSNTDINLLFGDEGKNVEYKDKQITMYVDLPMGMTLNSNSLLVDINCMAEHMIIANENVFIKD